MRKSKDLRDFKNIDIFEVSLRENMPFHIVNKL